VADRIVVVSYDPQWPLLFEAERRLLETVLAPWLVGGLHHIGATSVSGLASKPIIDIIAGVRDLEGARAAFAPLRGHSYVHTPHRPDVAHHFSKPSVRRSEATHGLHLTEAGSDLWRERLAFRDALRADPVLTAEYEALKLWLVDQHPTDLDAYTAGKRDFIAHVVASAGIRLRRTSS
jgi:GrpB-like predicted nucleotidyltransferase (UPF0157 family)